MTSLIKNIPSYIRIIPITWSFKESTSSNYITINSEDLYENLLQTINLKTTAYEVLKQSDTLKFFMDIEGIPINDTDLIFIIAENFSRYMKEKHNLEFSSYTITFNPGSCTHKGLSYHIIYDGIYSNICDIRTFISDYLKHEDNNINKFVDSSIYTRLRLFKLPLQIGINKDQIHERSDTNENYHRIIFHKNKSNIVASKLYNISDAALKYYHNHEIIFMNVDEINSKKYMMNTIIQLVPRNAKQCECTLPRNPNTKTTWISGHFNKDQENEILKINNKTDSEELIKLKLHILRTGMDKNIHVRKFVNEIDEYHKSNDSFDGFQALSLDELNVLLNIYLAKLNINI